MVTSKYFAAITATVLGLALVTCGFIVYAANIFDTTQIPEYQNRLFGDEIITLDIQADPQDWQDLLDNAQNKEWIAADLIINGERYSQVGVRTKGNSSLSQGTRSDSDKYSLQFKFDKYEKGQTYYGLDTFCINNMLGDATYMKDYLSYEIMKYIGVETPLTNYADVTVNGEDYGFCIALERYDKAYLGRAYNTSGGQLYNVKIQMGMRGNFEDMRQDTADEPQDRKQNAGGTGSSDRQQAGMDSGDGQPERSMGMGGFGQSGGGSLIYTDDNISSYAAIFENAVFKSSDTDKQRVITALKNLNDGTDLEKYFDVDEILRYFAAHTVVVNLDSYSSNMQQNYYIYERDGKLSILPWDYGLAFGGFQSGNTSSVVNFPIDTPVSGVSMENRPLLNKLLEVDEYRERYHEYLGQIVEGYFESGLFEKTINDVDAKIGEYVKNQSSTYYTFEQYKASLPVLTELGRLRAESIKGQLEGIIPSTTSAQQADSSSLIDASSVDLSALGSMMGGGGMDRGGPGGDQSGQNRQPGGQGGWQGGQDGGFGMPGGGEVDMNLMMQAMQIITDAGGEELTTETKEALMQLGLTEEQIDMVFNMRNMMPGGNETVDGQGNAPNGNTLPQGNMPGGNRMENSPEATEQSSIDIGYVVTIGVLLILLAGATIYVAMPRKNMM